MLLEFEIEIFLVVLTKTFIKNTENHLNFEKFVMSGRDLKTIQSIKDFWEKIQNRKFHRTGRLIESIE